MKTILISGGSGRLAQSISHTKNFKVYPILHETMDITDFEEVWSYLKDFKCDYFIHTAALTKPLSQHNENPSLSISTNILGTCNIVNVCIEHKIKLIYISTDYVYPGTEGNYKETDPVLPFTNYGWSKLGGECAVQMYSNSLIIRLCMCNYPFSHEYAYTNMIKNYIYEKEASQIILKLLDETGIINVGGPTMSVYEFAKRNNPNIKPLQSSSKHLNTSMNLEKMESI